MADSALYGEIEEDDDDYDAMDEIPRSMRNSDYAAAGKPKVVSYRTKSEVDDGHQWHKYGQKHVKGSPHPRSYYQCTYKGCSVKKRVVRDLEDPKYVITSYKGVHNHDTARSGAKTIRVTTGSPTNVDSFRTGSDISGITGLDLGGGPTRWGDSLRVSSTKGKGTIEVEEHGNNDLVPKCDREMDKVVTTRTKSNVDVSDDGYRWRKYGQKDMLGRTYPRSYYKCRYAGCSARKHVERDSNDPEFFITTYSGVHNHDIATPRAKSMSHVTTERDSFCTESDISGITNLHLGGEAKRRSDTLRIGSSKGDSTIEGNGNNNNFPKGYREMDNVVTSRIKSDVDVIDDGYRWRKYDQKLVKGNTYPRSYYRCTHARCPARKTIYRDSANLRFVITEVRNAHSHAAVATTKRQTSNHIATQSASSGSEYETSSITSLNLGIGKTSTAETRHEGHLGGAMSMSNSLRFGWDQNHQTNAATLDDVGFEIESLANDSFISFESRPSGNDDPLSLIWSPLKTRFDYSDTASFLDFGVQTSVTEKANPLPENYSLSSVLEEIDATMVDLELGISSSPENRSHGKLQSLVSYLEEQQEAEEVADRMLDMDGNYCRPAAPPERETLVHGSDWRATLLPEARQIIVNKIMESLKMQLSVLDQQILQELKRIAVKFEERNYTAANGHVDYLRKISLKMLKLEGEFKNSLPDSSAAKSAGCGNKPPGTAHNTFQSGIKPPGGTLGMVESNWFQLEDSMYTEELYLSKSPSPSYLCAQNFISIFLPHCNVRQLWNGGEQLLVNLKCLAVNHSSLFRIPDLSMARKLENLNLEGCTNLVRVSSVKHLTNLQHLNLKRCRSLKGLPSLIKLKLLKTLNLSHCSNLRKLPPSLGCLSCLCELNLRNCIKLNNLPRSVVNMMRSLEILNVSGCSSLWKSISAPEDAALPLSVQPQHDITVQTTLGALHLENLPSSSSIPMHQSFEDATLESQPNEPVEVDATGKCASTEGSPSQELSLDLSDIWRKETLESDDVGAFIITPLIDLLPSGAKIRELLAPNMDSNSNACMASSSEDSSFPALNNIRNEGSDDEKSTTEAVRQEEDVQQLVNDVKHEDPEIIGKNQQIVGAEFICHQVEGYDVNPSSKKANPTLVPKVMQQFCQQCSRFHVLGEIDQERFLHHHRKNKRPNEVSSDKTDSEGKCLLMKRTRTSYNDSAGTDLSSHSLESLEEYLTMSLEDLDNGNALSNIENAIHTMIELYSSSSNHYDKATMEGMLAYLAELKEIVPKTMKSMQNAKSEASAITGKKTELDASLGHGQLHLSLLDAEMSLISAEEEDIEAEIQLLLEKKQALLLV